MRAHLSDAEVDETILVHHLWSGMKRRKQVISSVIVGVALLSERFLLRPMRRLREAFSQR